MFRQDDLSQFFLGNSGPLKRQNEQRTQYFRDYEKSKRSRQFLKEWKQNRPWLVDTDRGCSGSQKVGARKIARCHFQVPVLKVRSQFRSQLKFLQGANFFEPKQWMIACTTTSFMFSFMYKWSGFVCTNVNVCIVLLFFISISSSKTKRFI
jgi:hypothetical protein